MNAFSYKAACSMTDISIQIEENGLTALLYDTVLQNSIESSGSREAWRLDEFSGSRTHGFNIANTTVHHWT
jgi:hypothetical protein